ncbi:MAG: thioredoxin-disulfide reductase [bacterium]
MEKERYDVIVAGAGPGGMACALYAARAGFSVVAIDQGAPGGQMTMTEKIDNYPGFPDGVDGNELAELMLKQTQRFGAEIAYGFITGVEKKDDGNIIVKLDEESVSCRAFVIATGAAPKELGVPGESKLRGRGVSYCAVCDGFFFKGQQVCVIGGGDAAVEEAVYLSNLCAKVTVIHRRDKLRAAKHAIDAALAHENIEFALNTKVLAVNGADGVESLRVADAVSGAERDIPCTGVFMYVGVNPISEFVRGAIEIDDYGFIKTSDEMETNIKGIYAVGDVRRPRNRQVATAVSDGATAALSIERVLNQQPDRFRK